MPYALAHPDAQAVTPICLRLLGLSQYSNLNISSALLTQSNPTAGFTDCKYVTLLLTPAKQKGLSSCRKTSDMAACKAGTDLQVCSGLDIGELVGQGEHGRAVLQELLQHKVQQRGLAVRALHICQLQQCIQLEACHTP